MKKIVFLITFLVIFVALIALNDEEYLEENGFETIRKARTSEQRTLRDIPEGGLLLIPESGDDKVMAFDPETGDLVDADFIPADPENLSTPIAASLHPDGNSILISDQIEDGLLQYDLDGNFMGWFAPAGGVNNAILDNVRGWDIKADGNILVTTASGSNSDAIVEFDTSGNHIGNFIANGAGGLDGPFCVLYRETQDDYLVSASSSDALHQYDNSGAYIGDLVAGLNFLEQFSITPSGNLLIAEFSTPSGCYEYTSDGTFVGHYDVITSLRGVYELGNGNILVTNGNGVFEIDRDNTLVSTKIDNVSARFIYFVSGETTTGTVDGFINDADLGSALEGVMVTLGTNTTTTDETGYYNLNVDPDIYVLSCNLAGYEEYIQENVEVIVGETVSIDVELQHLYNPPHTLVWDFIEPDVILSWQAPIGQGLTGYNVYRDLTIIHTGTELTYTDQNVPTGTYTYNVSALYYDLYESDLTGDLVVEVVAADDVFNVDANQLIGNIPNPFNPSTAISFSLENPGHVSIEIYNVKGKKIRTLINQHLEATTHSVVWNGKDDQAQDAASGVYFYKMKSGNYTASKKMILMK
ncbi:MAG: carboxypeptidase regulatory-like domain-containing protein [Candidatus Cloacimonetes bacterium]|nr:carboxypeptidase regulatory-like domain-containing protein [Candidatus Cloacimonadota bacterium]